MKANYGYRFVPNNDERRAVPLNSKSAQLTAMVWEEAQRQYNVERDRLTLSIISCMLVALNRRYGWGARPLTAVYKEAVELIGSWKVDLRDNSERRRTGENPENYALMEELRKIGIDLNALEDECRYDTETGEVTWNETEAR